MREYFVTFCDGDIFSGGNMVALSLAPPVQVPVTDFDWANQSREETPYPTHCDAGVHLINALFETDLELTRLWLGAGARISNTHIVPDGPEAGRSLLTLVAVNQVDREVADLIVEVAQWQAGQG